MVIYLKLKTYSSEGQEFEQTDELHVSSKKEAQEVLEIMNDFDLPDDPRYKIDPKKAPPTFWDAGGHHEVLLSALDENGVDRSDWLEGWVDFQA